MALNLTKITIDFLKSNEGQKFTAKEISCVEELPTFVFSLGHKDLFL